MANPLMTISATTLTFRPGCLQATNTRRVARQRRLVSSNGTVRVREVSSVKDDFLQIRFQQLHREDEGSFSGWDSLLTFMTDTANYSETIISFVDADGDTYSLRFWDSDIEYDEIKKDVFDSTLLFRVESQTTTTLFEDTYTDDDGSITVGGHVADIPVSPAVDYQQGGDNFDIFTNQLECTSGGTGRARLATDVDVASLETADEWRWSTVEIVDFFDGGGGSWIDFAVQRNSDITESGMEYIAFRLSTDFVPDPSTYVEVYAIRKDAADGGATFGALSEETLVGQIEHTGTGSSPNYFEGDIHDWGMTFVSDTTVQFWREPAGGGARTIIGSHTFSEVYNDSSHRRSGYTIVGGSGATITVRIEKVTATETS